MTGPHLVGGTGVKGERSECYGPCSFGREARPRALLRASACSEPSPSGRDAPGPVVPGLAKAPVCASPMIRSSRNVIVTRKQTLHV
jgi:hypothetical protein